MELVGPAAVPRAALPARVLRRPAAAHRHRPGAHPRAGPHRLRRAGQRARREHPGPGPEPPALAPARVRAHLPVHRPQHGRRRAHQRPGGGHVPRLDGRALRVARDLPASAPPVHDRAAVGGAGRHAAWSRASAADHPARGRAVAGQPAVGLPVPHPLLAAPAARQSRALRHRASADALAHRRARGRLPLRGGAAPRAGSRQAHRRCGPHQLRVRHERRGGVRDRASDRSRRLRPRRRATRTSTAGSDAPAAVPCRHGVPHRARADRPAPRRGGRATSSSPPIACAAAAAEGADLLVLPELALTGYLLQDLVPDVAMHASDPRLAAIGADAPELLVAVGFVEETDDHRYCEQRGARARRDRARRASQGLPADVRPVRRGPLHAAGRSGAHHRCRRAGRAHRPQRVRGLLAPHRAAPPGAGTAPRCS